MLTFGGLSFTALQDNTIEINTHGVKQSLTVSDVKELNNWLDYFIRETYNRPSKMQFAPNAAWPNPLQGIVDNGLQPAARPMRNWDEVINDAMGQGPELIG